MNTNKASPAKKKMMGGFMCHSQAATAVCMNPDFGSVIVPRRPTDDRTLIDDTRLSTINNAKYTRLVESRRFSDQRLSDKRSVSVPSIRKRQAFEGHPKPLQKQLSPDHSSDNVFQVVVMRVSLHCQGCAGKVKKHLSKMEGVTSFSIDLETKRVTVMGHVSPVGVLESISKVKRAEFWTS
ncbi:hypothetical protein FNV43_RR22078 [Rhamnella rubrinervis]|uniref:HMA domain-containing protein n=1 Tax=Rhamnella rubrinervis TaxID=2594499 RepID=A0A8K0DQV4_9ROSA|nr:hypothetical protein FNV43_RR22078 [Rhamnella rubrinervis]